MANPNQKKILREKAYDVIKVICTKFQDESVDKDGSNNSTKRTCYGLGQRWK